MKKISVLIIDDSALMRNLVSKIISHESGMTVVGTALNGVIGLKKVEELQPDVITLDLEMPELDGIAFLRELHQRKIDTPVIILSSLAHAGAKITMQALSLGACDFVTKPSGSISLDIKDISKELCEKIYAHYHFYQKKKGALGSKEEERPLLDPKNPKKNSTWPKYTPPSKLYTPKILCIGASTGGPFALKSFLSGLSQDFPLPILIIQHMPKEFTGPFAESLNSICSLDVQEATDGAIIHPGKVYIAPGDMHMTMEDKKMVRVVRLNQQEPRNGHRPSVDVLFASAAKAYDGNVMAILMTGMGEDGAREMGTLFSKGAITIAQDRDSCVVYGMPKSAIEHHYVQYVMNLEEMPSRITEIIQQYY